MCIFHAVSLISTVKQQETNNSEGGLENTEVTEVF